MFRRKKTVEEDQVEQRFATMMELIKDLPRADYNRLKDAMDLGYNAYQKVKNVKTAIEKENTEFLQVESALAKEDK